MFRGNATSWFASARSRADASAAASVSAVSPPSAHWRSRTQLIVASSVVRAERMSATKVWNLKTCGGALRSPSVWQP